MDIRLLWIFIMLAVWWPALLGWYDTLAYAVVGVFSIAVTGQTLYFWVRFKEKPNE